MNKTPSYCYIRRKDLEKKMARIFFQYSTKRQNPEERIELEQTDDMDKDAKSIRQLVQVELSGSKKAILKRENEVVGDGTKMTIDKYFVCIQ